jgi:hypothetical protein
MINILSLDELELLAQLQGSELTFYGGPNLGNFQTATCIVICSSKSKLEISGDVLFETFQGYPNEYSKLEIHAAKPETLSETVAQGNTYLFHHGETIIGVEVVEETVEEWVGGKNTWVYRTDVAVILKFETGFISISKLHHNHEVLHVEHSANQQEMGSIQIESFFEEDLLTTYKVSQRTLNPELAKSRSK